MQVLNTRAHYLTVGQLVTMDNALSAQFEHTVLVTETGYEILTDRTKV